MPTDYEVNLRSNGTNVLTEFISKGEGFIPRDSNVNFMANFLLCRVDSVYTALVSHGGMARTKPPRRLRFRVKSSGNNPRLLRSILRATPHCGGIQSIEDEPGKCEVKNKID